MKPDKSVCKVWLGILEELKRTEFRKKKSYNLTFKPSNWKEEDLFNELLERDNPPISATILKLPHDFDSLRMKVTDPYSTLSTYSVNIIQPRFDHFRKECEELSGEIQRFELKDCFGFEETTFWLRRIAGENVVIDFRPQGKNQLTASFCFMKALVEFLRSNGRFNKDERFSAFVPEEYLANYIKDNFPKIDFNENWKKNAKGALVKKVKNYQESIKIGNFNSKDDGYQISIKIPQALLV